MPSAYILPADYETFGIADATDAQVASASRMVDAQIGRPDGLLWAADANGLPAWMAGKTPSRTYTLTSPLAAGDAVTITLPFGAFGPGSVGSPVVLDRSNDQAAETCIITAATGTKLTLANAQFAHAAGGTLDFGLAITEEVRIAHGGMARTAARPLARVLSITGSYRGVNQPYLDCIDELLTIGSTTSILNPFPVSQCDVDEITGICWLLPGDVRSGFSRVKLSYIAGWSYDTLPEAIKQAVAAIVRGGIDSGMPAGNWKMIKDGDATIERFSGGLIDAATMGLLSPYRNFRI